MAQIIVLTFLYVVLLAYQVPILYKDREITALSVYVVGMIFSFIVAVLLLLDIELPTPTDAINKVFMEFARRFFS